MSITYYPDGSSLTSTALTETQIQTAFQVVTAQMLGILTSPWSFKITNAAIGAFVVPVNSLVNLYQGEVVVALGVPTGTQISGIDLVDQTITLTNSITANGSNIAASVTDPQAFYKVRIGWQTEGQPGPSIGTDIVTLRCSPIDTEYGRMRDLVSTNSDSQITYTDVFTRAWRVSWTLYGPDALDDARAIRSALDTIQFVTDYLSGFNLYVNPSIKEPQRVPENFQGRWWERVDLEAEFNEQITETFTVGIVESVEVQVFTKEGKISDFTVSS
jgi:hypothetical protein